MKFYSAKKKNEILSFAGKWLELENITLSEVSQVQKPKVYMLSLTSGIKTLLVLVQEILRKRGHDKV
jgi:hypothetical protein